MGDSKWLTGWEVMMIIVKGDDVRLMRVIDIARAGVCSCMCLRRRCCGIDVEPPHPGSRLFTEPLENDCPSFVDYFDLGPGEDNCASWQNRPMLRRLFVKVLMMWQSSLPAGKSGRRSLACPMD